MIDNMDATFHPERYVRLPPRIKDEKDSDYLMRVKTFTQGFESGQDSMCLMFDRLIEAMESQTFKIPNGLSREEKRKFILNSVIEGDI